MKTWKRFADWKGNTKGGRKVLPLLLSAALLLSSGMTEFMVGTEYVYAEEAGTEEVVQTAETRTGVISPEETAKAEPKTETLPPEETAKAEPKTETQPSEETVETEPKTETQPSEETVETEPKTETQPSEEAVETEPGTETQPSEETVETEPKTETQPSEETVETEPGTEIQPPEETVETEPETETLPLVEGSEAETVPQTEESELMSETPSSETESETLEEETEFSEAVRAFLDAASALPDEITEENEKEAEELLKVCDAAYQKLTEEEKALPEVVEAFARVQRLRGLQAFKVEYGKQVTVDGITYKFDFDTDTKTAALEDILEPDQPTAVSVPGKVTYQGEEYTVTKSAMMWYGNSDTRLNVTELKLPDTMTQITGNFRQFRALESITIPGSVKVFGGTFQFMTNLKSITFGEGVEEISSGSIVSDCSSLTKIQLPSTLKRISGTGVFSDAPALAEIQLPEGLQFDPNVGSAFRNCASLQNITLPASVTTIHSNMFRGCKSLQSVTANGTITAVESYAFHECRALNSIPDLSKVTSMEANAFYYCDQLQNVSLDLSALDVIPSKAFSYSGATIGAFSENLQSIGIWAMLACRVAGNSQDGNELVFPETLTSIGTYAFWYGDLPQKIIIPDSVTEVGENAFLEADGVEEIWIGSGVTQINPEAFSANGLKKITVNNSKDALTNPENFPEGVEIEYLFASIGDVDDRISDAEGAPRLQEAVNAAKNGETIKIEKDVKLAETLKIPAGKNVTIASEETFTILGDKKSNLKNLIEVEAGASAAFGGNLILSGRYNSKSTIASQGQVMLTGNAAVSNARMAYDYIGIIDISGGSGKFTMNGGSVEKNTANGQECGIIRVSGGASVQIQGGTIRNNKIIGGNNFNSSSGILLSGSSSGTMSGGTISGNSSYRGSAIMLYSSMGEGHAAFTMSNGTISGNAWTKEQTDLRGAGAVYIEGDASFQMSGGSIVGNSGEIGGGVAVADSGIYSSPYNTRFIMTGGEISNNSAVIAGGGIYSYSNGVSLQSGSITGNSAGKMGGGIYSEGNAYAYSTLSMQNAYITGNQAEQGGGLWLCPTGDAKVRVKNGGIIHGNTAGSVGDDVVSAPSVGGNYSLTLADRVAGGGRVLWYTDGSVYMGSGGSLYPSVGEEPRYNEKSQANRVNGLTKGAALKAVIGQAALGLAASKTSLVISGNYAKYGGGVGANGGVVIGEDDQGMNIPVEKRWEHGENPSESQPQSISVSLYNEGGVLLETITLNAKNNWKGVFEGLPIGVYTISETEVPGYTTEVTGSSQNGFVITNTFRPVPKGKLTVEKMVTGNAGDQNLYFTFTVTLGDKTISGEYGDMVFQDGTATFVLKHDERKTAVGLPLGVTYQVLEQEANQNGYTTTVTEASGTITEDGSTALFINAKDAPETETETETETESETEPPTEAETETETEPLTEPETETETEPSTEPETETETEPPTEAETETETEPPTELETETETGTKPGRETEPPKEPGAGTSDKSAKTGDESRPVLWLTLFVISGITLLSLLTVGRARHVGRRRK